jgi:hypothetical protein
MAPAGRQCSVTSSSCGCPKRFLVIIVSPDGDVQNRVIFTGGFTTSQLVGSVEFSQFTIPAWQSRKSWTA